MPAASMYGARQRTQREKANDAFAFIFNARPAALLAMTSDKLCLDKGIKDRKLRQEVEYRLLTAQARERGRDA